MKHTRTLTTRSKKNELYKMDILSLYEKKLCKREFEGEPKCIYDINILNSINEIYYTTY